MRQANQARKGFRKGSRYLDDHPSLRERAERESSPVRDLGGGSSSDQCGSLVCERGKQVWLVYCC